MRGVAQVSPPAAGRPRGALVAGTPDAHPRPDRRRERWYPLDGDPLWDFAFDDDERGLAEGWQRGDTPFPLRIRVPFVPQCTASGIGDASPHEVLWYRRCFANPAGSGERLLLHFGAVEEIGRASCRERV